MGPPKVTCTVKRCRLSSWRWFGKIACPDMFDTLKTKADPSGLGKRWGAGKHHNKPPGASAGSSLPKLKPMEMRFEAVHLPTTLLSMCL
mmetsp:Transcript_128724/g.412369  ORF Transcript_128724/g.412369 Transcript_128724/m.412369 type:complete len:89 (+) Transcript_128724:1375-1641(+)